MGRLATIFGRFGVTCEPHPRRRHHTGRHGKRPIGTRLQRLEHLEDRRLLSIDMGGLAHTAIPPDRFWQAAAEVQAPSPEARVAVLADRFGVFLLDASSLRSA